MKTILACVLLSAACILSTEAQTPSPTPQIPSALSVGSHDYTGCIYKRHDVAFLYFTHDAGAGRVEIAKLPPDIQKLLDFNPQKASEEKVQALSKAVSIQKSLKDLELLKNLQITLDGKYSYITQKPWIQGAWIRPESVTLRTEAVGLIGQYDTSVDQVFVAGAPAAAEGEAFTRQIYPTGRTVKGDEVTYRLFAASPELALSLINESKLDVAQVISACKSTLLRPKDL